MSLLTAMGNWAQAGRWGAGQLWGRASPYLGAVGRGIWGTTAGRRAAYGAGIGAGAGGLYGGLSDNGSMIGGAFKGAMGGAAIGGLGTPLASAFRSGWNMRRAAAAAGSMGPGGAPMGFFGRMRNQASFFGTAFARQIKRDAQGAKLWANNMGSTIKGLWTR